MSSVTDEIKCPKCGYEYAQYIYMCRTLDEHVICARCGYCGSYERDIDASKESGGPVWHLKETGGSGSCILTQKGYGGYTVGPMEDVLLDKVKERLDDYELCKYTFWQDEQWYIKDVLNNTEKPFNEDDLYGRGDSSETEFENQIQIMKGEAMKELEIYVVQYCESDAIWVFASKSEAVKHIEYQMEKYMADGIKVVWTWNCRDACTVRLEDNSKDPNCDRDGFYTIRKDSVELSEKDVEKLTVADNNNG